MTSSKDLATLTCGDFEPHVSDIFSLQSPAGALSLRLAAVRKLGAAQRAGGAFSLEFVSPVGPVLPQATYILDHSAFGPLAIFLVPIGRNEDGVSYQAIFT
jgi:hypothetical protein